MFLLVWMTEIVFVWMTAVAITVGVTEVAILLFFHLCILATKRRVRYSISISVNSLTRRCVILINLIIISV